MYDPHPFIVNQQQSLWKHVLSVLQKWIPTQLPSIQSKAVITQPNAEAEKGKKSVRSLVPELEFGNRISDINLFFVVLWYDNFMEEFPVQP